MRSTRMRNKTRVIALLMMLVWMLTSTVANVSAYEGELYSGVASAGDQADSGYAADDGEIEGVGEGYSEIAGTSGNMGIQPFSTWTPGLQRRDWQDHGIASDAPRVAFNSVPPGPLLTNSMDSGAMWQAFFDWSERINNPNSSGHANYADIRHPANPLYREIAFRVWHGTPYTSYHFELVQDSSVPFPAYRWNVQHFQYAYVQYLYFNLNFCGDGVDEDIVPAWRRAVIMGSYYDRMFVFLNTNPGWNGADNPYQTLRNYLFPKSATCPVNTSAIGHFPPANRDVYRTGFIFGGWFCNPDYARNLGSQDGRVHERTDRVTTALSRSIYARWYPIPTIEKAANPATLTATQVEAGAKITYTLTVDVGDMPPALINLQVRDNLPAGLTFVPNTLTYNVVDGITNNSVGNDLRFTIAGLTETPADGLITITFQASVATDTPAGTIPNIARLYGPPPTGGGDDDRTEMNRDNAVVGVDQPPTPSIAKAASPSTLTVAQVAAGATITYTLTVDVRGIPLNMIDLEVRDNLPLGLTLVPGSVNSNIGIGGTTGVTDNSEGNTVVVTIDGLTTAPPNGFIVITFRANVATNTPAGPIRNEAILWGPPGDDGERERLDEDEEIVTVQPSTPTIEKTVSPSTLSVEQVAAGATLTYTLTVDVGNLPPASINLEVVDTLPASLTLVPNSVSFNVAQGVTNNSQGNNLRFTIGGLTATPPNGLIVITFQASVATNTPAGYINNTAILLGPPPADGGPRPEIGRDGAVVTVVGGGGGINGGTPKTGDMMSNSVVAYFMLLAFSTLLGGEVIKRRKR